MHTSKPRKPKRQKAAETTNHCDHEAAAEEHEPTVDQLKTEKKLSSPSAVCVTSNRYKASCLKRFKHSCALIKR